MNKKEGANGMTIDEWTLLIFSENANGKGKRLTDEEILDEARAQFAGEEFSLYWVAERRSRYNRGRLPMQQKMKPKKECPKWYLWPSGARKTKRASLIVHKPKKTDPLPQKEEEGRTEIYCPLRTTIIATMRCAQYQTRNGCGETCTMKATKKEIAMVRANMGSRHTITAEF